MLDNEKLPVLSNVVSYPFWSGVTLLPALWIRIRIKLKGRIRIWISIKMASWIRIRTRITVTRITTLHATKHFLLQSDSTGTCIFYIRFRTLSLFAYTWKPGIGQFVLLRYDKCSLLKPACCKWKNLSRNGLENTGKQIGAEIREKGSHYIQSQRPTVRTCLVSCWRIFHLGDFGSCYIRGIKWQLVYLSQ